MLSINNAYMWRKVTKLFENGKEKQRIFEKRLISPSSLQQLHWAEADKILRKINSGNGYHHYRCQFYKDV